jgi:hypothetical protein
MPEGSPAVQGGVTHPARSIRGKAEQETGQGLASFADILRVSRRNIIEPPIGKVTIMKDYFSLDASPKR